MLSVRRAIPPKGTRRRTIFYKGDFMMYKLQTHIKNYLEYCNTQKCLDEKTLKAYRIDLRQFLEQLSIPDVTEITSCELET